MALSAPAILVLGPTASGKSSLAIELAVQLEHDHSLGAECISADSMQIYRGMDIGTAKTSLGERRGIPHHLIDIVEPSDDSFSVDRWLAMCSHAIKEIQARGRIPIIVGGTNLYVQALLHGLAESLPAPNPDLRHQLSALPLDALRERLIAVDPRVADVIHFNDRKRAIRAIEVFEQTGSRLSELQTQWQSTSAAHGMRQTDFFIVGLDPSVEEVNRRINARVRAMIEHGLVEEVRRLHGAHALGRNAREALGYKQIVDFLEGRCSLEDAVEEIKIRTRRYAKQQRTWLRRFRARLPAIWLDPFNNSIQTLADQILASFREHMTHR